MIQRLTLGSLATVSLPQLGVKDVIAKVDTGAFSGALHCTNLRVERKDDKKTLFFTPLGDESLATTTNDFKEIIVRSANGHESVRYVIPVVIEIDKKAYHTLIGLSDRTVMTRDMLLGRRFLLEHDALVDVSLTKEQDHEADRIGGEV